MRSKPAFIAGDWGTSHLRLSLCGSDGESLAEKHGPGVSMLKGELESCLLQLAAEWDETYGALPAILCGMAGSTLGLREAPYVRAPADLKAIIGAALRFEAAGRFVAILPGVSCRNPLAAPDLMRGEETQIAGAFSLEPELQHGRHTLCLPGTHTKWAIVEDGAIVNFLTGLSGELYSIIHRHSILAHQTEPPSIRADEAFRLGLAQAERDAGLIHNLFQTRSRVLTGELRREAASAFLSGLIIGQDVFGALRILPGAKPREITVIGSPDLTALYAEALKRADANSRIVDGISASRAGLSAAFRSMQRQGLIDAA